MIHEAVCMAVVTGSEDACDCGKNDLPVFLPAQEFSFVMVGIRCPYPQCDWGSGYLDENATVAGEPIMEVFEREYQEHCRDIHA